MAVERHGRRIFPTFSVTIRAGVQISFENLYRLFVTF